MDEQVVIDIIGKAILVTLEASAPMLIFGLVIGVLVSIFQAVTSIQEQTLAFVPKIVSIFLALMIFGSWILNLLVGFASELLTNFGRFLV